MKLSYNNDETLTINGIKLNKAEIQELKMFLNKLVLNQEDMVKSLYVKRADDKRKKLLEMVERGEVNGLTLRQIAKRCGYNGPQSVKYVLDKLKEN